jgi:hypothetical protein
VSLELAKGQPGLWINKKDPEAAGIHALIIGVSRYDHLGGGKAPASETFGLGQLSASALTAYRVFEWLNDRYVFSEWPVVRVRLLMSPLRKGVGHATADELNDCDPSICAHAPEASFANCKEALENWYSDMEALQPPAKGRSLFFFSGHGIERRMNYQVLLPSDYMAPPGRLMNNALSTPNIADSLPFLQCVASHVLLLDGCRDDVDKLRGATGAAILNDSPAHKANPLFEKGALYATAFGLRAYSPKSGKLSLFGQALLEGLQNEPDPVLGEAPIELIRRGPVSRVEINKLGSYMNRRVDALIKDAKESVVQVVRSEVQSADPGKAIEIAELPHHDEELLDEKFDLDIDIDPGRLVLGGDLQLPRASTPEAWFQQRYGTVLPAEFAPFGSVAGMHLYPIFGSDAIAGPWVQTLRVTGLSTRQTDYYDAVELLSSAQARQTEDLHRVQVHFRLRSVDPVGHILTIKNWRGRNFCCVLPNDLEPRIFQLEIDVQDYDYIRFAVYLSPDNEGTTGSVATSWDEMRALDPLTAAQRIVASGVAEGLDEAFRNGKEALRLKVRAPLAAAVASVLLLKGNQFHLMHDWARNVGNWFPSIPDGVVVWTEQRRRMAGGEPLPPRLIQWFVRQLSRRSLPFTADSFGIAADLLTDITRGRLQASELVRDAAHVLLARFDAAAPYFRDAGMFSSFVGWPDDWDPAAKLGARR